MYKKNEKNYLYELVQKSPKIDFFTYMEFAAIFLIQKKICR
jgi:hypothetical protein